MPSTGRSGGRQWGDLVAAGGASSSVEPIGGQFSTGAAVGARGRRWPGAPPSVALLDADLWSFGRPPPHILTVHVATILTHVSATIRLALRPLR